MYSVLPVWSVSQMPAAPLAVLMTVPALVAAEVAGADVVVGAGAVVVVLPLAAGVVLPPHAAATNATAASETPNPSVRTEILRSMVFLPADLDQSRICPSRAHVPYGPSRRKV
jgi:hypothetical protein